MSLTKRQILFISLGLFALYVIIVGTVQFQDPTFEISRFIKWVFIGAIVGIIFGGGFYYFFEKNEKSIKIDKELPPAITFIQARKIAIDYLRDPRYMDEIDLETPEVEDVRPIGKPSSQVYVLIGQGKFTDNRYAIAINMHYPDNLRGVVVNKTDAEITKMINSKAIYPENEPAKRITTSVNPLLGTEQRIEEITPTIEKEKEEKDVLKKDGD